MTKIVFKNSFFSVLQVILSTLSYIIIYYLILNKLGKNELGVWSIITALPVAVSVFGSGVSGCVLRHVPIYNINADRKAFTEIIFSGTLLNILFGLLIVVLGFFFSKEILLVLFSNKNIPLYYIGLFKIALITFLINFVNSVLFSAIDGLQLIFIRNKIVIIGSVIFCFVAFILIRDFAIKGILIAQLIQSLCLFILAITVIVKQPLFDHLALKSRSSYFKMFLTFGQSFQLISISILLFDPITKYFLNRYFNLSTVGIYDVILRAVTQIRILIVSAVQAITPHISAQQEENNLNINETYNATLRGAKLLSYVLYGAYIPISMLAVYFFDQTNIFTYLLITILLIIAYHSNILASVAYSIFIGLGKLRSIIISHFLSTIINICLFIVLGKYIFKEFIALPTSLSILVSSIYLIYSFKKEYKIINNSVAKDFKVLLLAIITVSLTFGLIFFHFKLLYWLILLCLHFTILIWLVYHNDFFNNILHKLLRKGN